MIGRPAVSAPAPSAAPFAHLRAACGLAASFALACLTWVVAGRVLPGGRWLAVHLFTLGVLTNLVAAFSDHFARTLLRVPGERGVGSLVVLNVGVLMVLVGVPGGQPIAVALGGTVVMAAVARGYVRLRRDRRAAIGARFSWVVRAYERAHGAFVHGATLGVLMGTGLLPGGWYAAVRLAHLHLMLLGWAGLTLLATLVFFGPTVLRARIEPGAEKVAAVGLHRGATALTIGVVGLLLIGAPGGWSAAGRGVAAAGLGFYAYAALMVCRPVLRLESKRKDAAGGFLRAACVWFVAVVVADVAVVLAGAWRLLDALGVALLAGVLAQAILATLVYVGPMLASGGPDRRAVIRARLDVLAPPRLLAFNLAALLVVTAAAAGRSGWGPAAAVGWALFVVVLITQPLLLALPFRGEVRAR